MKTRELTRLAMFLAISIVLAIFEASIPVPIPVPGVKLGLANVVVLICLYQHSKKQTAMILIMRILLVAVLRGSLLTPGFYLSLSGGMFALVMMLTFKQVKGLSIITVSVLGSLGHAVGQILVAMVLIGTTSVIYYLPVIILLSVPTGILTGMIAKKFVCTMCID